MNLKTETAIIPAQAALARKVLANIGKAEADAKPTLVSGPKVQDRYGISHVTLWRWEKTGHQGFPKSFKIGRLNYWKLSDLEAWEAKLASMVAA